MPVIVPAKHRPGTFVRDRPRDTRSLLGSQRLDVRQHLLELRLGKELAAEHDRIDLPAVADVGERVRVEQDKVRDLTRFNRAEILLLAEVPCRVQCGGLQGFYWGQAGLDEERFRQLGEGDIAKLWKSGHLDLVYAVMLASGQIFKLIRLKNQRIALGRAWHSNAG